MQLQEENRSLRAAINRITIFATPQTAARLRYVTVVSIIINTYCLIVIANPRRTQIRELDLLPGYRADCRQSQLLNL